MKNILLLFGLALLWACENSKLVKKAIIKPVETCVCLQPYGNLDSIYVNTSAFAIQKQFKQKTKILATKPLPESAFTLKIKDLKPYNPPARYRADSLLRHLLRIKPKFCTYIIGITNQDISCTNRDKKGLIQNPTWMHADWGIFGLGLRPGASCVVSTHRLSFWTYDKTLIKSRVRKTITHELGHNFGLSHCTEKDCNMRAADQANALLATDKESEEVCEKCRRYLRKTIN